MFYVQNRACIIQGLTIEIQYQATYSHNYRNKGMIDGFRLYDLIKATRL